MRVHALVAATVLLAAAPVRAQSAPGGAFVITLGRDTVAVERYTVDGRTLRGTSVVRTPRTSVRRYEITLAEDGSAERFHLLAGPPGAAPRNELTVTYPADSVVMEQRRDTTTRRIATALAGHLLPVFEDLAGVWEVALRGAAPPTLRFANGRNTTDFAVQRTGGALTLHEPEWGTIVARMNGERLAEMDMTGSTSKYVVRRVADLDVEARAAAWARADQAGRAMGVLSPRDTARASVAGATVLVDYGRPAARGRKVFGGVVPFGEVWRTGANEATQLVTDRTLQIGEATVPPGTYSLFTIPTASGWTLIVNKQHGQWGTEYDAAQDLARIPVTVKPLARPVERFTITIAPSKTGGVLELAWADTQASVPFTVR
ncbi:MAG TPA: DUF2911 domain-containing protein [Longimicrobiales bacterium]|nr:DUF2911 domain-containing protein [Longimicrobiales bacterium]